MQSHGCLWNEWACIHAAASRGHLEVLQWAQSQGCPWNEETCANAAEGGHLKVASKVKVAPGMQGNVPMLLFDSNRLVHGHVLDLLHALACCNHLHLLAPPPSNYCSSLLLYFFIKVLYCTFLITLGRAQTLCESFIYPVVCALRPNWKFQ